MNKYVFIDLDNTLIAAEWNCFSKTRTRVDLIKEDNRSESYGVILRPGAHDLLKALREKYQNVYLLTAASHDYATKMNEVFAFEFKPNEIISRDLYYENHNFIEATNIKSVLIDDQHYDAPNAWRKVNYLKLFGTVEYIQVKSFFGHKNSNLHPNMIESILQATEAHFTKT